MSSSTLIRCSGLAAILGGALLVITDLGLALILGGSATYTGTTAEQTASVLFLIGKILIVVALVGLYLYQMEAAGRFGLFALLTALVGTSLMVGSDWLFGVATFRARVFPRLAGAVLVVGVLLPLFVGVPWIFVIWNAAIVWMGLIIRQDRRGAPSVEPVRIEALSQP
jgi:hypothetical protein